MFGYTSKLQISRFDANFIAILRNYIFEFFTKRTAASTQPLHQTLAKLLMIHNKALKNEQKLHNVLTKHIKILVQTSISKVTNFFKK